METRMERSERFAQMWRRSRENAGKSQSFMARSLGVSKRTVQNWEMGIGCPSQDKGFEWFRVLDVQPLAYYLALIYPDEFEGLSPASPDADIELALRKVMQDLPPSQKRKLLYMLAGKHGSSPTAVIELFTAHLQTPLKDRIHIAQYIVTNYDIAVSSHEVTHPEHIQPDMSVLRSAVQHGLQSIRNGCFSYTMMIAEVLP